MPPNRLSIGSARLHPSKFIMSNSKKLSNHRTGMNAYTIFSQEYYTVNRGRLILIVLCQIGGKPKKKKKREQKLPFFSIENVFPAQFVLLKLSIDLSVGGLVDPCKREIYRCYGVLLVAHASRCLQPSFGFLADLVCVIEGYALVEYLQ